LGNESCKTVGDAWEKKLYGLPYSLLPLLVATTGKKRLGNNSALAFLQLSSPPSWISSL
jgi:hypothetical protein